MNLIKMKMNLRLLKTNNEILSMHDKHIKSYFLITNGRTALIRKANISKLIKMLEKLAEQKNYHNNIIKYHKWAEPYCSEYKLKQIITNEILYRNIRGLS